MFSNFAALPNSNNSFKIIKKAVSVFPSGVSWNIDCIRPAAESLFRIRCELCRGGDQQFTVNANTPDELIATDSVVTRVQAAADLKLDVLDPKGPRPVGKPVEYEICVTNRGTDTARKIQIMAICSPELEPVEVTGNAVIESGQIFFRPVVELESAEANDHRPPGIR